MSLEDKTKWERRYVEGSYRDKNYPSSFLREWIPQLKLPGNKLSALDIACGLGRNTIYLAQQGFEVDAIDISSIAINNAILQAKQKNLKVNFIQSDLETEGLLPRTHYHLVFVCRYLQRNLFTSIKKSLVNGGYLIYETHLQPTDIELIETLGGPKNPSYRLKPDELYSLCHDLEVIHYFEGIKLDPDGTKVALAQIVARK